MIVANTLGYDKYVDETQATAAFKHADAKCCGITFPVTLLTQAQRNDMTHETHDVMGASNQPYHNDTADTQPREFMRDEPERHWRESTNILPRRASPRQTTYTPTGHSSEGRT